MYGPLSIVYIINNLLFAGRVEGGANVEKVDFSKLFSNYSHTARSRMADEELIDSCLCLLQLKVSMYSHVSLSWVSTKKTL